jgi:hypothetical protein
MKRAGLIPGLGGVAFGVLVVASLILASPPGGNYVANDVADFVARGHRLAVFASLYIFLLGILGLILLLARLRGSITGGNGAFASVFWGTGLAGAVCYAVGWGIALTPPMARAFGGASQVFFDPRVTYGIVVGGAIVMIGPGAFLLAVAMFSLALGSRGTLPTWLRRVTLAAAVIALFSIAYFPYFIIFIWAIVTGLWLLATGGPQATQVVDGAQT